MSKTVWNETLGRVAFVPGNRENSRSLQEKALPSVRKVRERGGARRASTMHIAETSQERGQGDEILR